MDATHPMNTSIVPLNETAKTSLEAASIRAQRLAAGGSKRVLEACVGPSLKTLEEQYTLHNIECWGNDIDKRWQAYYPNGKWLIGDVMQLQFNQFDTVVFAPPLSKGCTGKREDALSPLSVQPSYLDFIKLLDKQVPLTKFVLVLPGRSLSTKQDRDETYHIINKASEVGIVKSKPIYVKNVMKYLDLEIVLI